MEELFTTIGILLLIGGLFYYLYTKNKKKTILEANLYQSNTIEKKNVELARNELKYKNSGLFLLLFVICHSWWVYVIFFPYNEGVMALAFTGIPLAPILFWFLFFKKYCNFSIIYSISAILGIVLLSAFIYGFIF